MTRLVILVALLLSLFSFGPRLPEEQLVVDNASGHGPPDAQTPLAGQDDPSEVATVVVGCEQGGEGDEDSEQGRGGSGRVRESPSELDDFELELSELMSRLTRPRGER